MAFSPRKTHPLKSWKQIVTKVKLLYLARIKAVTSIIYSSVYNVLIATNWVIGEKQLTIVYIQIWNHRIYGRNRRWYLHRKQEMVFTQETGDGTYIGNRRWYLRRKQEIIFTEETGDGIYRGHRRWYLQRKQEMVFTEDTGDGI